MKIPEYEPVGGSPYPRALRRDDSVVLTCAYCGCRLTPRQSLADGGGAGPDAAWRHYRGSPDHAARGCRVACRDMPHRIGPPESPAGE